MCADGIGGDVGHSLYSYEYNASMPDCAIIDLIRRRARRHRWWPAAGDPAGPFASVGK